MSDVSIGGTVSIAGTLTYEDVTNVDAVGLITARDGIKVGSGITLSVDGDGFFTGVVTATTFSGAFSGDGSALTGVANTDVIFTDKITLPDSSAGSINVGCWFRFADISYWIQTPILQTLAHLELVVLVQLILNFLLVIAQGGM